MLNWDLQKNNDKITLFLFGNYLAARCYQCGSSVAFLSASTLDKTIVEWNLSDLQHIDSHGLAAVCYFLLECHLLA